MKSMTHSHLCSLKMNSHTFQNVMHFTLGCQQASTDQKALCLHAYNLWTETFSNRGIFWMKLPDNENRTLLSNPRASPIPYLCLYSIFISSIYTLAIWSLSSFSFPPISPSSSHNKETQGKPFLFTEGSSLESKMCFPSLEFSAWWFLLLSSASAHQLVQV